MTLETYFDYVIFPILALAVLISFIRLYKGPNIADRIIALDLIITIGIAMVTAFSIRSEKALFLDVAMIFALIAFLGTIALSFYLYKSKQS